MKWATRTGCHIDRAACAWLIRTRIDSKAEFVFVDDPDDIPPGAVPFDMRGVDLTHHGDDCTFETILRRHELDDPVLWDLARIVHEADLHDDLYDVPEAYGFDVILRALALTRPDPDVLDIATTIFDALYEYRRRVLLTGRNPT
jgi:hypothetical protein